MTQGERVKKIRKSLGLTLEKFGEKLGVGKTAISKIEKGENNLTEQMTRSICREFNVDYIWLTIEEGEMFVKNDIMKIIDRIMISENVFHKKLLKFCALMDEHELEHLENMIDKYLKAMKED